MFVKQCAGNEVTTCIENGLRAYFNDNILTSILVPSEMSYPSYIANITVHNVLNHQSLYNYVTKPHAMTVLHGYVDLEDINLTATTEIMLNI